MAAESFYSPGLWPVIALGDHVAWSVALATLRSWEYDHGLWDHYAPEDSEVSGLNSPSSTIESHIVPARVLYSTL